MYIYEIDKVNYWVMSGKRKVRIHAVIKQGCVIALLRTEAASCFGNAYALHAPCKIVKQW